jgi:N-hydroxyarylamine O-acetyltransferase
MIKVMVQTDRLTRYFSRIQYREENPSPNLTTLRQLHFLHATQIPFENLDILLGRRISLKSEDLHRKLVDEKRGGYCFEQNTLFYEILKEIGFEVIPCEARVRFGIPAVMPRTHMTLLVTLEGSRYLCDVGFGGEGLLYPVAVSKASQKQFHWEYRMKSEGNVEVLQSLTKDGWFDLYAFEPSERYAVDFEVANWYTSTHPESRFVQSLTAQLPAPEARHILRNRTYVIDNGTEQRMREVQSHQELLELLRKVFHLDFPEDITFNIDLFSKGGS